MKRILTLLLLIASVSLTFAQNQPAPPTKPTAPAILGSSTTPGDGSVTLTVVGGASPNVIINNKVTTYTKPIVFTADQIKNGPIKLNVSSAGHIKAGKTCGFTQGEITIDKTGAGWLNISLINGWDYGMTISGGGASITFSAGNVKQLPNIKGVFPSGCQQCVGTVSSNPTCPKYAGKSCASTAKCVVNAHSSNYTVSFLGSVPQPGTTTKQKTGKPTKLQAPTGKTPTTPGETPKPAGQPTTTPGQPTTPGQKTPTQPGQTPATPGQPTTFN